MTLMNQIRRHLNNYGHPEHGHYRMTKQGSQVKITSNRLETIALSLRGSFDVYRAQRCIIVRSK